MNTWQKIKVIFKIRIAMWVVAAVATIYWTYWSFKIYDGGFMDEHAYATALRPIFARGLIISLAALLISLLLRRYSDKLKEKAKYEENL